MNFNKHTQAMINAHPDRPQRRSSIFSLERLLFVVLSLGLLFGFTSTQLSSVPSAQAKRADFSEVAERAMPGVVAIKIVKRARATSSHQEEMLRRFFGERGSQMPRRGPAVEGQGSGFIISKDGYILTNTHVVGEADGIEVHLEDGRVLSATLIGADKKSDVAVIKVNAPRLPVLEMGDSKKIKIGQWVIAIGNPFGFSATLTAGIISATGRAGMGITDYEEFIQTDAAINPGNSGGPLLNDSGQVIGINTAIFSRSGGSMGIGFAIPINMALKIKEQLIAYGEVHRSQLGVRIQDVTPAIAESLGLKRNRGVLIVEVLPDSPAERAGLEVGDVVQKLNGERVTSTAVFRNRISLHRPQEKVKLTIFRRQAQQTLAVTLASLDPSKRPRKRERDVQPQEHRADEYGLEIRDLTADAQERLGLKTRAGVLIQHVVRDSIAAQAGLQAGDVILSANQIKVRNVAAFKRVVKKSKGSLLLHVAGRRGPRFLVLTK